MAKLNTRHANGELTMFSDFTGGLNLSKPPETIADDELAEALNFEFAPDTGMLRTRGGLSPVRAFEGGVDDIIPISGDVLFVKRGRHVDRIDMKTWAVEETWDLSSGGDAWDRPAAFDFWGDSFQVVMAFGGHLWWSTEDGELEQIEGNGIAWTEGKDIPAAVTWDSVCHGGGLFVAVSTRSAAQAAQHVFARSLDGFSWAGTAMFGGHYLRSVCWSPELGLFVAVGGYDASDGRCMTSPDGITWTQRTAVSGQWQSVCYGDGLFVAVGSSKCMTSPDGINWTQRTAVSGAWKSVCWGGGMYVAVSANGGCMTSPDGATWTQRTAISSSWQSVCWGGGLFVAVSDSGKAMTSPDGISWTQRTAISGQWQSVCWGGGLFVAVGYSGKCMTSPDGINWAESPCLSGSWRSVCYGGGKFVAVSYDGKAMSAQDWGALPSKVEQIFIRDGRVFLTETGSDTLRASGVGDLANWRQDTDMDSISVEVGYKDGCDMKAIVEFAGEMIAFKAPPGRPEWGRVYRLQGRYPDWNIQLYSRGNSTWNARSAVSIPNDVLFLSKGGMMSLGTVTEYGDFKIGWAGSKVNAVLAPALTEGCRIWHLPSKGQAWVSDGAGSDVWVYHYQLQAWTKFAFGGKVKAVSDDGARTYVGIGDTLYVMSDETPCELPASLRLRTGVRRGQQLIKGVIAGYGSGEGTVATLRLGGYELALPYGGQVAGGSPGTGITRARCNVRGWQTTPEISVTGGPFSLASLGLEVAEV